MLSEESLNLGAHTEPIIIIASKLDKEVVVACSATTKPGKLYVEVKEEAAG
jgi:hypothetical protein